MTWCRSVQIFGENRIGCPNLKFPASFLHHLQRLGRFVCVLIFKSVTSQLVTRGSSGLNPLAASRPFRHVGGFVSFSSSHVSLFECFDFS